MIFDADYYAYIEAQMVVKATDIPVTKVGKLYVGLIRSTVKGKDNYYAALMLGTDNPQAGTFYTMRKKSSSGKEHANVNGHELVSDRKEWKEGDKFKSVDGDIVLMLLLGEVDASDKIDRIIKSVAKMLVDLTRDPKTPPMGWKSFSNELAVSLSFVFTAIANLKFNDDMTRSTHLLSKDFLNGRHVEVLLGRCALDVIGPKQSLANAFEYKDGSMMITALRPYNRPPPCTSGPSSIPRFDASYEQWHCLTQW